MKIFYNYTHFLYLHSNMKIKLHMISNNTEPTRNSPKLLKMTKLKYFPTLTTIFINIYIFA